MSRSTATSSKNGPSTAKSSSSSSGETTLWNLPGLDLDTFSAAAKYLHLADEQQFVIENPQHFLEGNKGPFSSDAQWNNDGEGEGPWELDHSSDTDEATQISNEQQRISERMNDSKEQLITQQFLDRLAQVFACEKKFDKNKARVLGEDISNLNQRPPAAGVTATALVKREQQIDIFVAKNKGLEDSDKAFASSLFAWLNCPDPDQISNRAVGAQHSTPTWDKILDFSEPKIRWHVASILQKQNKWHENRKETLEMVRNRDPSLHDSVLNIFNKIDELINLCNEQAGMMQSQNQISPSNQRVKILNTADEIRSSKIFRQFHSYFRKAKLETQENLSILAKHINFLGRLPAAWRTFQKYVRRHQKHTFKFHAVKPPAFKQINLKTLKERIESYPKDMSHKRDALNLLAKGGGPGFTVHCEMQLLLHFDALSKYKVQFDYFGCSKRSCWMCQQMLESHGSYRTKATHGRRVGLWAFDSTNPSPKILFALKSLQDKLTDKILEEALRARLSAKQNELNTTHNSNETKQQQTAELVKASRLLEEASTLNTAHKSKETKQPQTAELVKASRLLEKASRLLKKSELDPCDMSTADVSTSRGDKLAERHVDDTTTIPRRVHSWAEQQQTITEQAQPSGEISVFQIPGNGDPPEVRKVQLIPRSKKAYPNVPAMKRWVNGGPDDYYPNLATLTGVREDHVWGISALSLPDRSKQKVAVVFNVDFDFKEAPNGYFKDVATRFKLDFGQNGITIPHGDVILIALDDVNSVENIPFFAKTGLEDVCLEWLKADRFPREARSHHEYLESFGTRYHKYY